MRTQLFKLFSILLLGLTLSGCVFHNPFKSWVKAQNRVAIAQTNLTSVDRTIKNDGAKYLYGTKLALAASPTNQATELAADFNDKAIGVFGAPSPNDITALQNMVDNLLSSNKTLIAQGEKDKAALNNQVTKLQSHETSLQSKLANAEANLQKVGLSNAKLAAKWARIVHLFWTGIYLILAVIVLRVVTIFLPPPYNAISIVISVPCTWVVRFITWAVPEVITGMGWIVKEGETLVDSKTPAK